METTIKVFEILKNKKITKLSNGTNIFNHMLSEYKKNDKINKFILDMSEITVCTVFVFKEIIRQMQARLDGNFGLEVINAGQLVAQQFKMALSR